MEDDWAKESAKHGIGEEGMMHAAKCWCIPKSLSQSSKYDDFANKFDDQAMKTIE